MHAIALLPCLLAPLATPLVAQDEPASELLEGHSIHGEAFNEGPRQAATLMPNPGNVHFPVTSAHPDVQAMFDQGVGQLHGFWYFEAERSFRQVAAWDPDCAMAYWGMAMANFENRERAQAFAQEAWDRRDHADARERRYLEAWARFFGVEVDAEEAPAGPPDGHGSGSGQGNGKGPGPGGGAGKGSDEARVDAAEANAGDEADAETADAQDPAQPEPDPAEGAAEDAAEELDPEQMKAALRTLITDIEKIIRAYPDDIEAKAFLVVHSWFGGYAGLEITSRQALQSVLDEVFDVQPNHPAHHYRIHLWDKEETSEYAVSSAVASGPSWPGIAHMWHMGGHIFENLGRHADAAWQQDASARIDHGHMMRDLVLPDQIHNYAHNNEWLVRSLSHCGRIDEALEIARNMTELPRHPAWNLPGKGGTSAFWGQRRLAGTLQLFELWDDVVALGETGYLPPVEVSEVADDGTGADGLEEAAHRAFVLGEAHLHLGNAAEADAQRARLDELLKVAKLQRALRLDTAEEEALAAKKERKLIREAIDGAIEEQASTLDRLRGMRATLDALRDALAPSGDTDFVAALEVLEENDYAEATLARLYLDAMLPEKAEELARSAAEDALGQAQPNANLAFVLDAVGKREEALEVFRELRAYSSGFDLELAPFARLAPLAAAEDLPADWRAAPIERADVGSRPALDTLGPRRWTPPAAPAWACPDSLGLEHSLASTSGRPRVLILFLGFGCAHCVEQLQAFGPAAEDFAAAGIDLIAIGDDGAEELGKYNVSDYPFPILADPEYDVFRAYRCYDDFEDAPLHGTFLIDADDRLRWFDVSYEPFTDTAFLLKESQRLLGLPTL